MTRRPRILVPVYERLDGPMSALGTRRLEIACALSERCDVTLASATATAPETIRGVAVEPMGTGRQFRRLLDRHEFLYTLSIFPKHAFAIARSGIRVILDLYAPVAYECLEAYPEMPTALVDRLHRHKVWWTAQQIRMADVLAATNSRQVDFWIGVANQLGKLDAARIRRDPSLGNSIIELPLAVPPGTPTRSGSPLRAKLGLAADDFVFLWSGKILAWQDPAVLLRAMTLLRDRVPEIKLVFLGVGDPVAPSKASWLDPSVLRTHEARRLAEASGLVGNNVFFVDQRINYADLGAYYRDCDAAVATYPDSVETRLCLATRLADYLWAELPIAVAGGSLQRDFTDGQGIGYCSPPGDAAALAENMTRIRRRVQVADWDANCFAAAKKRYSPEALAAPLVDWCQRHVGDRGKGRSGMRELLATARFWAEDRRFRAVLARH